MPAVSVIITAFRRPEAVKEAIASALEQTYRVHEVIVVDDASGDGTPDAVRNFSDPRVRLVTLTDNLGQSGALNAGIDAASGDIVALLDSDDLWLPEKVATQLAAWLGAEDRDNVLFSSRVLNELDDVFVSIGPASMLRRGERIDEYLFLRGGLLQMSTLFLSRSLAKTVRFDESTRRHGDLAFLLRAADHGVRICQLHAPLTRYRSSSIATRISSTANLDSSLRWFDTYGPKMSARAQIGFRYRNHIAILRKRDRKAARQLRLQAVRAGVIQWADVKRGLTKLVRLPALWKRASQ